jgi:GntR family transcriptional regulator, transcriptional repressor for pyruvate dehydrogenase complex
MNSAAGGDLFVPLDDRPAYRQIANLIERRIVARSLRTGDPLPSETDLARQFGVNRSTVREAIRELEIQGLIGRSRGEKRLRVTRPQPGSISSGVSRALALHDVTFLELWEAMMALEPAAAQYAASRRSTSQLHTVMQAAATFKREAADTPSAVAAVVDFFTAVAEASGNQVLALSQAPLNVLIGPALTRVIDRVPQACSRIQLAQDKITTAIKLKRSEQARIWMERHIRDFKRGHDLELASTPPKQSPK